MVDEVTIAWIAKICHNANKDFCEMHADFTQSQWERAPEAIRESAIAGVKFRIEYPDSTPANQHDAWCKHKLGQGWKHGPVKDMDKLEHPCLVSYEELPQFQQKKDKLFANIVKALI